MLAISKDFMSKASLYDKLSKFLLGKCTKSMFLIFLVIPIV